MDARIIIPATFGVRSIAAFAFRFITNPAHWSSYFLCVILIAGSLVQFLAVEAIFLRKMRSEVRGTLSGLATFFAAIGTTTFTLVGGILFDKIAPWAPFMVVATADFVCIIFAIIFIVSGKLKKDD